MIGKGNLAARGVPIHTQRVARLPLLTCMCGTDVDSVCLLLLLQSGAAAQLEADGSAAV